MEHAWNAGSGYLGAGREVDSERRGPMVRDRSPLPADAAPRRRRPTRGSTPPSHEVANTTSTTSTSPTTAATQARKTRRSKSGERSTSSSPTKPVHLSRDTPAKSQNCNPASQTCTEPGLLTRVRSAMGPPGGIPWGAWSLFFGWWLFRCRDVWCLRWSGRCALFVLLWFVLMSSRAVVTVVVVVAAAGLGASWWLVL